VNLVDELFYFAEGHPVENVASRHFVTNAVTGDRLFNGYRRMVSTNDISLMPTSADATKTTTVSKQMTSESTPTDQPHRRSMSPQTVKYYWNVEETEPKIVFIKCRSRVYTDIPAPVVAG
jgi:hypothetical protein